jgi:hypothetical protein
VASSKVKAVAKATSVSSDFILDSVSGVLDPPVRPAFAPKVASSLSHRTRALVPCGYVGGKGGSGAQLSRRPRRRRASDPARGDSILPSDSIGEIAWEFNFTRQLLYRLVPGRRSRRYTDAKSCHGIIVS